MLDLITSVTQVTHEKPENALTPSQVKFWFENVIPLIFDKNSDIQKSATTAVEAALPFIRLTSFQEHPNWPALEERIIKEYGETTSLKKSIFQKCPNELSDTQTL